MSAVVYTTAGGTRFHATPECPALLSAQALSDWDYDYEFPPPAGARLPQQHAIEPQQTLAAARDGYTACRACVPPAVALPNVGETYGHEPVRVDCGAWTGEQIVCARCTELLPRFLPRSRRRHRSVHWPCASAAALGLVVTDAARWNAAYPVGTPVLAWPWTRTDEPLRTRTRTPAWRLHNGESLVSVDGRTGGICLTHVEAR